MIGKHVVRTWSRTVTPIMLSSAEAELHGLVKASAEGIGMKGLLRDFGREVEVEVYGDASAALSIIGRCGVGKVRHLNTSLLWVQEKAAKRQILYHKVKGTENVADLMTKGLNRMMISRYCHEMRMTFASGRSRLAPEIATMIDGEKKNKPALDSWREDDGEGCWTREHFKPRSTLFTPMSVRQGPASEKEVGKRRVTIGKWCAGENQFVIIDDWTRNGCAHRCMGSLWTGRTYFGRDSVARACEDMHTHSPIPSDSDGKTLLLSTANNMFELEKKHHRHGMKSDEERLTRSRQGGVLTESR